MKRQLLSAVVLLSCSLAFAQQKPFVVPAIGEWKPSKGELQWSQLTSISYNNALLQNEADYLTGFMGNVPATEGKGGAVSLQLCNNKKLGAEGYQLISEKTWRAVNDTLGYDAWDNQRKVLGEGYRCNQLGNTQIQLTEIKPNSIINPSDEAQIGYDYQVEFDITWASEPKGTILMENPYSCVWLSDPIGGWLGFSRNGYLYTFNYKGKPGHAEHIAIRGTNRSTSLYVNGKSVQELGIEKRFYMKDKTYNYIRTLVFPLQKTGSFNSRITNFKARKIKEQSQLIMES